jgi:hypothetical protein
MKKKRWPAARIAKLWLEISLGLGLLAGAALLFWVAVVSPFTWDDGSAVDLTVYAAVGNRSVLPVLPLTLDEPSNFARERFRQARLVRAEGELRMLTTSPFHHYACMLTYLGAIGLAVWVTWMLRCVVATALEGQPFDRKNSYRLRLVGLVVIAGGLLWPLLQFLIARSVLNQLSVTELPLAPAFSLSSDPFLVGLLLLVLASVFSHGADLEDERSFTI